MPTRWHFVPLSSSQENIFMFLFQFVKFIPFFSLSPPSFFSPSFFSQVLREIFFEVCFLACEFFETLARRQVFGAFKWVEFPSCIFPALYLTYFGWNGLQLPTCSKKLISSGQLILRARKAQNAVGTKKKSSSLRSKKKTGGPTEPKCYAWKFLVFSQIQNSCKSRTEGECLINLCPLLWILITGRGGGRREKKRSHQW